MKWRCARIPPLYRPITRPSPAGCFVCRCLWMLRLPSCAWRSSTSPCTARCGRLRSSPTLRCAVSLRARLPVRVRVRVRVRVCAGVG